MPFGKHRGRLLSELDDAYLTWLTNLELREPLRTHVYLEVERRRGTLAASLSFPPELRSVAEQLITAGFRSLAREVHPDHGGDGESMRTVNACVEALRRFVGTGRN